MRSILLAAGIMLASVTASSALDCAAPATPAETVLCTDPEVQALEATLGNALKVALDNSRQADRDVLTANQEVFVENRTIDCDYDENGDAETPAGLRQCLLTETDARIRYLTGQPLEGPGAADPMVPQVFQGKDSSFIWSARFVDPKTEGEKLFNHLVYEALKDIHLAKDENDYTDNFSLVVQYASPQLISANVDLAYLGPDHPHPMPYNFAINVDLAAAKELTTADAFDAPALKSFEALCDAQLSDYISAGEEGADVRRANIAQIVNDLRSWTFGATAASLAYLDYGLDSPATCTLGYDVLRPVIKAGFPLPK